MLLKISAKDADMGTNAEIHYSLHGPGADSFYLDAESGKLAYRPSCCVNFITITPLIDLIYLI